MMLTYSLLATAHLSYLGIATMLVGVLLCPAVAVYVRLTAGC